MKFTWEKFDPAFLKTVLLASEEFADMHEDIKEEDDIIGLVARMNIINVPTISIAPRATPPTTLYKKA